MAAPQSDTALIKNYFEMDLKEAKAELTSQGGLTREDKADLAQGIRDGSLTYPARTAPDREAA
jgi:hypothetical protein